MKTRIICLTLLFVASIAQLSAQFSIKGKITEGEIKEAVVLAKVSLVNTQITAVSDIDGNYELKNVPPGTYILKSELISYDHFQQ